MARLLLLLVGLPFCLYAQPVDSIDAALLQRHLLFLTSDSLKGRGNYTPELQQAAYYIAAEFKKAGLRTLPGMEGYFHPFTNKNLEPAQLVPDSGDRYNPQQVLLNVIGVLPGKTKPAEVVIFSAHYDHITPADFGADRINNGANDNASGTAAVLALAQYYAAKNNNERTLIFCAFAGEEIGLVGSQVFSTRLQATAIKAMINIEMIGRHDFSGRRAFFLTGAGNSSLERIFRKNLKGKNVRLRPEPDLQKNLFQRSDNYPFAREAVVAHTVMASDDEDACYHRPCDELHRIDVPNMVHIIQAIVTGAATIISGQDTPVLWRRGE